MPTRSDLEWLFDSSQRATVPAPSTSAPTGALTPAQEWDQLRAAFASSIMVDTALSSLAQNLDGLEWPLTGRDETPSTYIDFTHAELVAELTRRGQPAAEALLREILRETLAFDQPFGEMVKQTESSADRDNPLLRNLVRLGIPDAFPLTLATLDETARQLCELEHVTTLGEFALFAQRLSQGVIVGGDTRRLLNALAQIDEATLAQILPFRVGVTGLHLEEALVQAAGCKTPEERASRAIAWFADEYREWRQKAAADHTFLSRRFAALEDPRLKERAVALLAPHFRDLHPGASLWSRFIRWLRA